MGYMGYVDSTFEYGGADIDRNCITESFLRVTAGQVVKICQNPSSSGMWEWTSP